MHITLEEAKKYLRVTSGDDDELIKSLLKTAEAQVQDMTRLPDDEYEKDSSMIDIAVLYSTAYMYEHREDADYNELDLTLRALLFGVRMEGF